MKKISCILIISMLFTLILSNVTSFAADIRISLNKSTYYHGDRVTVTGTSASGKDITLRVITDGEVRFNDQIEGKNNNGTFSFYFTIPDIWPYGTYTVVAGYESTIGAENFTLKEESTGGGGGGGGGKKDSSTPSPTPTPTPINTPAPTPDNALIEQLGKITQNLMTEIDSVLNNTSASDDQIAQAIQKASEIIQTQVVTEMQKIQNNNQGDTALLTVSEAVAKMSKAVSSMKNTDQALTAIESVIQITSKLTDTATNLKLENTYDIVKATENAVNSVIQKAGVIDASKNQTTNTDDITILRVEHSAVLQQIEKVVETTKQIDAILQQNNQTQVSAELAKMVTVQLDKSTIKNAATIIIPNQTVDALKQNDVNIVATLGNVQFQILPQALQLDKVADYQTVNISIQKAKDEAALLQKKPADSTSIGIDVQDLEINAIDKQDKTVNIHEAFNSPITISISLAGVNLSNVDVEKIAPKYYNEKTGTWEIVAGAKYDPTANAIVFQVDHLSKYTLMLVNKNFQDIQGRWSQQFVEVAYAKGIIKGRSEDLFDPEANVTRAEFAAMLVRTLGLKKVAYNGEFKDISGDDWFKDDVATASKFGLVAGMGEGQFQPGANITREQMATMIGRALVNIKYRKASSAENTDMRFSQFADKDKVSSWAKDNLAVTIREGLMSGTSGTELSPNNLATREQAAKVMKLLFDK